jgi:hypothetical protein
MRMPSTEEAMTQLRKPIVRQARVRLTKDFPGRQGWVSAGHTGTVVFSDGDCVGIRLDQPVDHLADWGNILHFYGDHASDFDADSEVIAYCESLP